MSRPRLLLVPFFTELEWETLASRLEPWAEIASFDPPGIGREPRTPEIEAALESEDSLRLLTAYREAVAQRGAAEAEGRGWDRFFVVADSYGNQSAVGVAELARDRVAGLALGHATLSRTGEGERPTVVKEVFEAMGTLLQTDHEAFIAAAVAQLTQGAVGAEQAQRWLERLPDQLVLTLLWDAFGAAQEPIGRRLERLDLPLLLGEHVGCLVETHEGFEDFAAAFPGARTVPCPVACTASVEFAEALREFCGA